MNKNKNKIIKPIKIHNLKFNKIVLLYYKFFANYCDIEYLNIIYIIFDSLISFRLKLDKISVLKSQMKLLIMEN